MMTQIELDALADVVEYLLDNEHISYGEHLEEGGKPEDHIYDKAMTLDHYVRGLYSTGSEPKEKITEMEEKIKEQDKEINDLLKAIKEYERGES